MLGTIDASRVNFSYLQNACGYSMFTDKQLTLIHDSQIKTRIYLPVSPGLIATFSAHVLSSTAHVILMICGVSHV